MYLSGFGTELFKYCHQRLQLSRFGREISRFEANFPKSPALPLEFDFLPLKLCWIKNKYYINMWWQLLQHMRQHIPAFNQLQVPMMCLDCKSLSLNSIVILVRQYTDHWTQYSLNLWTAEAVINRASELWKSGKSRKWQSIRNYS